MARAKLKFRLHRAVIVLFCLTLLVALMQGASGLVKTTSDSATRSWKSWPARWRAGDAQHRPADAQRNTG